MEVLFFALMINKKNIKIRDLILKLLSYRARFFFFFYVRRIKKLFFSGKKDQKSF